MEKGCIVEDFLKDVGIVCLLKHSMIHRISLALFLWRLKPACLMLRVPLRSFSWRGAIRIYNYFDLVFIVLLEIDISEIVYFCVS